MSNAYRLPEGGMLIDRTKQVSFSLNGKTVQGYEGDTLASALIANGQHFVARSFKYHRPRGIVSAGVEEPNALFGTGEGATFEPNQRGTQVEIHNGLKAVTQNHFPSLERDIGSVNALLSRAFPAGFYYKTFLWPKFAWKHVYEPFIRQAAGLGKAPSERDEAEYEHYYHHTDVLVAGGGLAGIMAALAAGRAGARVLLCEQGTWLGGRAMVDDATVKADGEPSQSLSAYTRARIAELETQPNVVIRTRCQVSYMEDHAYILGYERLTDHDPSRSGPRHRLWRIRAGRVIAATGAIERPLAFAYNDVPGVMLASAMRDYLTLYGARPGDRVAVYTNNDDAYRTAIALRNAGVEVPAILDSRDGSNGDLPQMAREQGIRTLFGSGVTKTLGKKQVEGVEVSELRASGRPGAAEIVPCDALAMSGGWNPVVHLWSHTGGKLMWDDRQLAFRPDEARPPIRHDGAASVDCIGRANGHFEWRDIIADGLVAGAEAAALAGHDSEPMHTPVVEAPRDGGIEANWFTPAHGKLAVGNKHFIDFQNDVTAADVELAAREGYESVEHTKRYTTLGMATDQGKTSNINGLAILADTLKKEIPAVGTTTFRPPYTPISFGSIAGLEKNALFKPVRETPMHRWHADHGADWEPVGDWRRPFCYRRDGEDRETATNREIRTTREKVGMLDASTLGKIVVSGPDAGVFLDRIYTNMMSTLKVGRCRYGLMCNDNGYLFDDGVVVRLGENEFLCHTTSGGADRVHAWMEEWIQTEWYALRVFTTNVTEHYAQIAIAGPQARQVLEDLDGADGVRDFDFSAEALPFMSFVDGSLNGIPVRVHRISFSGELSYEIATPASYGLTLWEKLYAAGQVQGLCPYGTEALHVMRAEKGFIMIGDETDGTVTPGDLNLGWAVSKKKDDFIGMRAMKRPFLTDPSRKRLVGLETEDPTEVLPHAAHAVRELKASGPMDTIGHVTSTYWSPTLGRSIAMALIERGPERMGETLAFPLDKGKVVRAKIVDPVFYDSNNDRQKL
ncbi:MAG: sarcosine oxidase subunit alpha family protein [Pseudomonadota bacterium]